MDARVAMKGMFTAMDAMDARVAREWSKDGV
jgi:hypothetical protein